MAFPRPLLFERMLLDHRSLDAGESTESGSSHLLIVSHQSTRDDQLCRLVTAEEAQAGHQASTVKMPPRF